MLVDFLRYAKGYVHFKLENGIKERFINLCASNNIPIWKIKNVSDGLIGRCYKSNYNIVCNYAKISNSQINVLKHVGVPYVLGKYKRRFGLLVGLIIFFTFLITSQNFIWIIEFNGNEKLSSNRLTEQLYEIGIKKGAYIPAIDFRKKQQEAMLKISELGWISFNRDGSKIEVEISERVMAPKIAQQTPCDIIARKTGQVKYMEVYNGTSVIKLNDTVSKGDIIIKGETVNKKGETLCVHSAAKVIAEIQESKTFKINLTQTEKEYTEKISKKHSIDFFGIKIPLFIANNLQGPYEKSLDVKYISLFGNKLPIGIKTISYRFYDEKIQTLSTNEADKILQTAFLSYEKSNLSNCSITQRNISSFQNNNYYYLKIDYIYEEEIGKEVAINVTQQ